MHSLPPTGFLRLTHIIGQSAISEEQATRNRAAGRRNRRARSGTPPLIPVSATTWWAGVRSGRYPAPVKLGCSTAWKIEDILALIDELAASDRARK